jgi:hypothetical protein
LSGWLTSLANGKDAIGLSFLPNGQPYFGSPWFRYLNNQMSAPDAEPFHYVDLFFYASGLGQQTREIRLTESKRGKDVADQILVGFDNFIAVQPLTSDEKKNWGLERFGGALRSLHSLNPSLQFVILGSTEEAKALEPFVTSLAADGIKVKPAYCDLSTAFSILQRARLLLTGDTSIKHLASGSSTRIVELSLGSSYFQKTGAYQDGSIIIQAKEPCAPCPHRSPCSRDTHACAKQITPELVSLVVGKALEGHLSDLRFVAREFESEVDIFQVKITDAGYWSYHSLIPNNGEGTLARLIDLSSWKLFLRGELQKPMGEFGTESVHLRRTFKWAFPEIGFDEWSDLISSLEGRLERFESKLNVFMLDFKEFLKKYDQENLFSEFCKRLHAYVEKSDGDKVLTSYLVEFNAVLKDVLESSAPDFVRIRRINDVMIQSHQRVDVELRLLKQLRTNVAEKI